MNDFTHVCPVRVYFGKNAVEKYLPAELQLVGQTVMLVYGDNTIKDSHIYNDIKKCLATSGKTVIDFNMVVRRSYSLIQDAVLKAQHKNVDFILAVGDGAVVDCCKIVASQIGTMEDIWDMEFKKNTCPVNFLPMGVVSTSLGGGSEMNATAEIINDDENVCAEMFGAPVDFAILDPSYTSVVPMKKSMSEIFVTFAQCLESYFGSPRNDNTSDKMNESAMKNMVQNIRILLKDPDNYDARSELMWTAAVAASGILGVGKTADNQGILIARKILVNTKCTLGDVMAVILPTLYFHIYKGDKARFARFARRIWEVSDTGKSENLVALDGIDQFTAFVKSLGIPTNLRGLGIVDRDMVESIAYSVELSKNSCYELSHDEIFAIFMECY